MPSGPGALQEACQLGGLRCEPHQELFLNRFLGSVHTDYQ